jgi:hypothetical protein
VTVSATPMFAMVLFLVNACVGADGETAEPADSPTAKAAAKPSAAVPAAPSGASLSHMGELSVATPAQLAKLTTVFGAEDLERPKGEKPAIDWKGMSKAQRKTYMKKVVTPAAQKLFAAFDAKKYKKVTCALCHGDVSNGKYKMPNAELPKLPTTSEGFTHLREKKPATMKFMAEKVNPEVVALLGLPKWTPQNADGFGCYDCHTEAP